MILGSFIVTLLSALLATPFAIGAAVFMTEVSPKGARFLQPAIELLVGIPSVVYGFIGLQVVVPFTRSLFGGTGFGILSGVFVLFVMILPTVTFMTTDSLRAVPRHYREASMAMGATRWQTIWHVTLKAARSGIFTAVVFGMARAFGGSLGYPDGGRKLGSGTNLAHNTSFHPHLYFDHGNRKYRHGYGQ